MIPRPYHQASFLFPPSEIPGALHVRQVPGANTGFKTAMNLMNLDCASAEEAQEDGCTQTPACKKPRLAVDVARGLEITPPPVVGRQSETRFGAKFIGIFWVLATKHTY